MEVFYTGPDERTLAQTINQMIAEAHARMEREYLREHPIRGRLRRLHRMVCLH